jgi:acetyl esterase/lipase
MVWNSSPYGALRLLSLALVGLLISLSAATVSAQAGPGGKAAQERPAPGSAPRTLRDLSYLPGRAGETPEEGRGVADPQRSLDLYLPGLPGLPDLATASKPAPPLFVYVHGGAWISGDKRQYGPLGLSLAAQGVAVAIINYRLSGDGAAAVRHPLHAQDGAAAVAWLRKRAPAYGYDATRIFVGGHSAGAHLSAMLAFDGSLLAAVGERPDALAGFVGLEGIYDLVELVRRFPSYRVDFLQAAFGSDETGWRAASPQQLVGATAPKRPWLLIHSREDELVDLEQSRRFRQVLEKQGIPVRWQSPEHGSHFSVMSELATPRSALFQQLLAFLRG